MLLRHKRYEDFITPVLDVLDSLGGEAWLSDIKEAFHKRFVGNLEPGVDWDEIAKNHGDPLWEDHCGSRVSYHHLVPKELSTIERHGSKGSIWKITDRGRAWLRKNR
jgi:hypothetical protein